MRILIAQEARSLGMVADALRGYELLTATTLQEAERLLLEDGIDLFVVGIHFDDSRGVELIKVIRKDSRHAKNPIVVARLIPSDHAQILRQTMDVMCAMQVVNAYIEEDGQPGVEHRLREAVDKVVEEARSGALEVPQKSF